LNICGNAINEHIWLYIPGNNSSRTNHRSGTNLNASKYGDTASNSAAGAKDRSAKHWVTPPSQIVVVNSNDSRTDLDIILKHAPAGEVSQRGDAAAITYDCLLLNTNHVRNDGKISQYDFSPKNRIVTHYR
jgi:hypothetical protein